MTRFLPAPPRLVDEGMPAFGLFDGTVPVINGREARQRTPMGRAASPFARHFGYKQFQYFGVISDDWLLGCALADTAWIGLAFVYLYDTRSGTLHEISRRSPLARQLRMSASPRDGESVFRRGDLEVRLGYEQHDDGSLGKMLWIRAPELAVHARMTEAPDYRPMSLCTRTGMTGWTYANKVAGVKVEGVLQWQGRKYVLEQLGAFGHHDFSAGYMRRETFWNWACLTGRAGGRSIGLNLSCGVNETSFTENCLWIDGALVKVNTVRFDYDRQNLLQPWEIHDDAGLVALRFFPEGQHEERLDLALFASNFHQLFGRFEGVLRLPGGDEIRLDRQYGFVEEQFARW